MSEILNYPFSEVRVRFAPSPTGYLHVGGARSALFNYLYAKKNNGKFILRIEDTDLARSTDESLKMMVQDLNWLGIHWDEGVDPVTLKDIGPCAPYRQSERQDLYKKYAQDLLNTGRAYYCFMTDLELETQREKNKSDGTHAHIESPFSEWTLSQAQAELKNGKTAVVRFKTKHLRKDYILNDLIRGEVKFPSDMIGDFVLLRSDGMPVYNFCCVIDDALMKISHVLRAEEQAQLVEQDRMIVQKRIGIDDLERGLTSKRDQLAVTPQRGQLQVVATFLSSVHDRAFAAELEIDLGQLEPVGGRDQGLDARITG